MVKTSSEIYFVTCSVDSSIITFIEIYSLKIGFDKIIAQLEKEQRKAVDKAQEKIELLKNGGIVTNRPDLKSGGIRRMLDGFAVLSVFNFLFNSGAVSGNSFHEKVK